MEPTAPDRPAGKAEQDQLSDISSLPDMSVDPDTGTGGAANATANYGELTQANLTYLDRRNQPGVADTEVAPTATSQELATLTGRMLRPNPTVYGPSPRSIYGFPGGDKTSVNPSVNLSNQYQQQNNLYFQADTGPLVAQVADARHQAAMQHVGSQYGEHLRVTEEEARQSFDALKIQQANLESQLAAASRIAYEEAQEASNRKNAADERLRQTEVQADEIHNARVSDIRQVADQQIRQAYAAAHHAAALAELQSKNFAQEMNYFRSEITEVLGHLRSEQSAKIEADAKSRSLADELQRLNQQIQKEAPQGPRQLPTSSVGPLEYHMDSPPGLETQKPKTRIPEGGPPDDDDNDGDDDDDDKCKKGKKSKKDKKRKKKKRDSSTSSSSSTIPRDVMKALPKKMIKKDEDDEKDKDKGDKEKKEKTKEAEKVVFPKFPQPENYATGVLECEKQ